MVAKARAAPGDRRGRQQQERGPSDPCRRQGLDPAGDNQESPGRNDRHAERKRERGAVAQPSEENQKEAQRHQGIAQIGARRRLKGRRLVPHEIDGKQRRADHRPCECEPPAAHHDQEQHRRRKRHQAVGRGKGRREHEHYRPGLPARAAPARAIQAREGVAEGVEVLQCACPECPFVVGRRKQQRGGDRREQRTSRAIDGENQQCSRNHQQRAAEIHQDLKVQTTEEVPLNERGKTQRRDPMSAGKRKQIRQFSPQRLLIAKVVRHGENLNKIILPRKIHRVPLQHGDISRHEKRCQQPAHAASQLVADAR